MYERRWWSGRLFLASGTATNVGRVVLDDVYTNENTAARVDDAIVSMAIFRDCDLADTEPFVENGSGEFTTALINDEAEESEVWKNLKSRILAALSFGAPTQTTIRGREHTSSTAMGTLFS